MSAFGQQKTREPFRARGEQLCNIIGKKGSFYKNKVVHLPKAELGHPHGSRFVVLGRQFGTL